MTIWVRVKGAPRWRHLAVRGDMSPPLLLEVSRCQDDCCFTAKCFNAVTDACVHSTTRQHVGDAKRALELYADSLRVPE
jgi:hypothetical protein